ncbi:MAG: response regulator [Myxococcales bacterium]|nr:response regulator [Myxococcales bacterium]
MRTGQFTILCVDDDQDLLLALTALLEYAGYRVICAPSAEKGRRAFEEIKPDLVIIDLMMEEIDSGKDLVADLHAQAPSVPLYLLSSVADELAGQADFRAFGLSGVFQKPINPDALLETLRKKLKPAE